MYFFLRKFVQQTLYSAFVLQWPFIWTGSHRGHFIMCVLLKSWHLISFPGAISYYSKMCLESNTRRRWPLKLPSMIKCQRFSVLNLSTFTEKTDLHLFPATVFSLQQSVARHCCSYSIMVPIAKPSATDVKLAYLQPFILESSREHHFLLKGRC